MTLFECTTKSSHTVFDLLCSFDDNVEMPPMVIPSLPVEQDDQQLGILQILDRLEAVADNLLSRSVIFNRRIS